MKRNSMSIRKKIMIWFSLSLLLIVGITLALTFSISQSVFTTDIKTQLTAQVDANAQEIEFLNSLAGQETELGDQYLSFGDGFLEIDDDFCDYRNGVYTCLIDKENSLLYGECPVRLNQSQIFTFTQVSPIKYKGDRYYIYERPLQGKNLDGLWLRGVASQREGAHLLSSIIKLVMYLLPALAILSVLIGYLITRRSFAPLQKIMATAQSISGGNDLSRRIDLPPGKDELHKLASSYNDMFDRLEGAFQREKQFTSDVSHELRTPVSVILSQCEYSLELDERPEEYREALEVIQSQGLKMKDMITQLLFFSRLEQGREPLQMEITDLSRLAADICNEQQSLCHRPITIRQNISAGISALVDRRLFSRVLENLISNGIKYGRDGGYVEISLRQEPHQILLTVSDDGIGISPEDLPHIWSRFYQADSARSPEQSGVGLGLAMVKEIAELHGGSVRAESRIGQGSVFTVAFPIVVNP